MSTSSALLPIRRGTHTFRRAERRWRRRVVDHVERSRRFAFEMVVKTEQRVHNELVRSARASAAVDDVVFMCVCLFADVPNAAAESGDAHAAARDSARRDEAGARRACAFACASIDAPRPLARSARRPICCRRMPLRPTRRAARSTANIDTACTCTRPRAPACERKFSLTLWPTTFVSNWCGAALACASVVAHSAQKNKRAAGTRHRSFDCHR